MDTQESAKSGDLHSHGHMTYDCSLVTGFSNKTLEKIQT